MIRQDTINQIKRKVGNLLTIPKLEGCEVSSIYYNHMDDIIFTNIVNPKDTSVVFDVFLFIDIPSIIEREVWSRLYDLDVFAFLEHGGEIIFVSEQEHENIWNYFSDIEYDEIENQNGVEKYITYCISETDENSDSKEFLTQQAKEELKDFPSSCNLTIAQMNTIIKPKAPLLGTDGNIFNLLGIANKAMREAGICSKVITKMNNQTYLSPTYEEALEIILEYVDPVFEEEMNYH